MQAKTRSVEKIVEDQVRQWQLLQSETRKARNPLPVVTISREPGSGGQIIARKIADELGMDLFEQEVLHQMAQNADMSSRLVKSLDEKGLNVMEEYINALVHQRHLWPDQYLRHLLKVMKEMMHRASTQPAPSNNIFLGRAPSVTVTVMSCLATSAVEALPWALTACSSSW